MKGNILNKDINKIIIDAQECLEAMGNKQLLLTGGAGFLGYYIAYSVLAWNQLHPGKKINLTVLDNFGRGKPDWIHEVDNNDSITVLKHDILNPLPDSMPDFDFIMHAASIASPIFYRKDPLGTMRANVDGLQIIFDRCLKQEENGHPVTSVLFFSSSEIYGDPEPKHIPTKESYFGHVSCTGPRACYDESKRYGETLCVNHWRQLNIPVKVVRPFNNYGPGLQINDGRVIPDFCRCILNQQDIVMFSDGSPSRTFCYITDAITGYFKVLIKGRNGEAYNIGTDQPEISVRELAELLIEKGRTLTGFKGTLQLQVSNDKHYLSDNPQRRCPNIDKARAELDYSPSVGLEEGLRNTLQWYMDTSKEAD